MGEKVSLPLLYTDELRHELASRLNRIEGQVGGVSRMLEENRPCVQVLQQLASVQAALRGVSKAVLRNYLERCATDAIRSGDAGVYDELMETIYKFAK
jgi:DNA-binding FrmR family transcriptional regulator